ncbi:hypothetical protein J2Y69_001421 [Microbacterium resistens]|uniref:Uncharacterized protein n=1 Tax=Microbacterium resistens TaxID=156977 RepID=A0ABU1SB36_9MICO|nr:hypothetical protein [Microbacterium resistens]MDR6866822.1 hypothetical protein [Microbacterium resistens]
MQRDFQEIDANSNHEIKRRTIVKGAAWSLPVIAAAVAAPSAMASGTANATSGGIFTISYSSPTSNGFGFSAPIDSTACPDITGTVLSITEYWENGEVTTQTLGPSVTATFGPDGVSGAISNIDRSLSYLTRLEIVVDITGGCAPLGPTTYTWTPVFIGGAGPNSYSGTWVAA